MRLEGKVALITGAARGQGEAEARLFASEGARVIVADVMDDLGEKVAADIDATYVHLDVSQPGNWERAVPDRLDVLVNNAGILRFAAIESMPLDEYMTVVNVNQVGAFLGMQAAIPAMKRAGGGSIVNVASIEGVVGMPGVIAYSATKGAIRAMTKVAAVELGPHGIRVNAVLPGGVDTHMSRPEGLESLDDVGVFKRIPLRRSGSAGEIAQLVLFCASEESSYCTGAEFVADGGALATNVLKP